MIKLFSILLTVAFLCFGQSNIKLYYPEVMFGHRLPVQVLEYEGFSLGYCYKYKQSIWTIHELRAEELEGKARRKNKFRADSNIVKANQVVYPMDYWGTGYDRGHLVPAADFKYSQGSMNQTFLMTNMSPQKPSFNRGIWKRLEKKCRKWAKEKNAIYIVSGPVFKEREKLETSGIIIPTHFYKVIVEMGDDVHGIAFVIPNNRGILPLKSYVRSIDYVQALSDIDFFPGLPDSVELAIETKIKTDNWK